MAAAVVPLLCLKFLRNTSWTVKIIAVLLLACGVAKALFVASLFYDNTWDSRAYHADAILQLLNGVNPMYEMMHGFDDLWTNHYPKATWYFAAIITHLTGNYNVGKACNLFCLYAVAAYIFSFLKTRGSGTGNALLIACAAALNPVAISQLHTFYVDGALASLVTLMAFSGMAMMNNPRAIDKAVFILASCLLINIKFTGLAYVCVCYAACALALLYRWYKSKSLHDFKQGRTAAACIIFILLTGGVIMGYNPYITNTIMHGTPFFPLMGRGSIDVVAAQSPKSFVDHQYNNAEKVLISIFSRSENVEDKGGTSEPRIKIPFSVHKDELGLFFANDIRIGGWGALFGGILLLSVILYIASSSYRDKDIAVMIAALIVTILINPGSWWARYAPQVALLPLLMAIPAMGSKEAWQRITAKFVCVLLLLNSALIIPPSTRYFQETSAKIQQQIDDMVKSCGRGSYEISDTEGYHYEQFLDKNGIHIVYPKRDIRKTRPKTALFPLEKVFLHKEGCVNHPDNYQR